MTFLNLKQRHIKKLIFSLLPCYSELHSYIVFLLDMQLHRLKHDYVH